jgi:protein-arginine kinase activator protein McsA
LTPLTRLMSVESDNLKNISKDNKMNSKNEEPVICSKCNVTFESDDKFLQHYDEAHKAAAR